MTELLPPGGILHAIDQADTALSIAGLRDTNIFRVELKQARAVIQQNAEAALRLRALEQTLGEASGAAWPEIKGWIDRRTAEILREWKENGDE
jgi:hypothetical protein